MANVDKTFGFRPLHVQGPTELIECVALSSYGTALFIGDAVVLGGSSDSSGRPSVQQAAAGDANVFGVITNIDATSPDNLATHRGAASTTRIVQVAPAYPTTRFLVQANATLAAGDVGTRYDLVVASGSTTTGRSAMQLDVSTAATTGKTLLLLGTQNRPDNASTGTGVDCVVVFCESNFLNGAGV